MISKQIMNLAALSLKLKFCSLTSITYYVVLRILGVKEKNKDSGTLHSDMKQNIFILFQTILKSSVVKEGLSQAHLYIHTDMCVPANAIISVELKHSPE